MKGLALGIAVVLGVGSVGAQVVTRGPYLQSATPESLIVRWRTSSPSSSRVWFGTSPGELSSSEIVTSSSSEHVVTLTGLTPATTYYYAIGTATEVLDGDETFRFLTPPSIGSREPFRFWVIGDSGTANNDARAVRDAYREYTGSIPTALWLMLGDNAYPDGTDSQYQAAVFDTYSLMLRQSALWPTLGNHDDNSASSASQSGPYYDIFTLPTSAQAGGVASGTEAYYSFDYANVHFICLNSSDVDRTPGSPMLEWLENDLAATSQDWVVAFWHHPPYTRGSHNSNTELALRQMRQYAVPILEDYGVDLVLGGHSHSYERSFLLDGHYGSMFTLSASMLLDDGDGRIDGDGAYQKGTGGPAAHEGAVYAVAGSSGKTSAGPLDHNAMFFSMRVLGSLAIDVHGDRLDAVFLDNNGNQLDRFTIVKDTATLPVASFASSPGTGPAPLTVQFQDQSSTNAAWWSWDFENDGTPDSSERHPSHVYDAPGVYTVRLEVGNETGSHATLGVAPVCAGGQAPTSIPDLRVGDGGEIGWNAIAGTAYDLLRGDLVSLAGKGLSADETTCLTDGWESSSWTDSSSPAAEAGFYYLLRPEDCIGVPGSFDSSGTQQIMPRDPILSPTCP